MKDQEHDWDDYHARLALFLQIWQRRGRGGNNYRGAKRNVADLANANRKSRKRNTAALGRVVEDQDGEHGKKRRTA